MVWNADAEGASIGGIEVCWGAIAGWENEGELARPVFFGLRSPSFYFTEGSLYVRKQIFQRRTHKDERFFGRSLLSGLYQSCVLCAGSECWNRIGRKAYKGGCIGQRVDHVMKRNLGHDYWGMTK